MTDELWEHLRKKEKDQTGYDGPDRGEVEYPKTWTVERVEHLFTSNLPAIVKVNGVPLGTLWLRDEAEFRFLQRLFAGRNIQTKEGV